MRHRNNGSSPWSDLEGEIPLIRRYARKLAASRGEDYADDLVQDCLERALRKSSQFERGSNLRGWLCTILCHVHIDNMRRLGRCGVHVPADDAEGDLRRPAEQHAHLQLARTLAAMDDLRGPDRSVMRQVVLEGRRYADVASHLGIAEGTVKSRVSRARERLMAA